MIRKIISHSENSTQQLTLDDKFNIVESHGTLFQQKGVLGKKSELAMVDEFLKTIWNKGIENICLTALEDGKTDSKDLIVPINSKMKAWFRFTAEPVVKNRKIDGIRLTVLDVTPEKRLYKQNALRQKMTNISFLAAQIAHKLNNPLAAVLNRIGCLLVDDISVDDLKRIRSELELVQEQIYSMSIITNSLVSFSEEPKGMFRLIPINMIIEKSVELSKLLQGHNEISYRLNLDQDIPFILGSEITLEQSFVNILKNSIEAMPDGGTITINSSLDSLLPDFVKITFSDTGIGIPVENFEKIFDPFVKFKTGNHPGLGLSISYGIIANHGGIIEIKSKENAGTKLTVLLPTVNLK